MSTPNQEAVTALRDAFVISTSAAEGGEPVGLLWEDGEECLGCQARAPQRTPVRLPQKYKPIAASAWFGGPHSHRHRMRTDPAGDSARPEKVLGGGGLSNKGSALFISKVQQSGNAILSVSRDTDLSALGEVPEMHETAFQISASCGGLFLNDKVKGFTPDKACIWRHWGERLHYEHPNLGDILRRGGAALGVFRRSLSLFSFIPGLSRAAYAADNNLTSLAWLMIKRITKEIKEQQANGQEVNIGTAFNNVIKKHMDLVDPLLTAFFLGAFSRVWISFPFILIYIFKQTILHRFMRGRKKRLVICVYA